MSALPLEADMLSVGINVCYVPKADICPRRAQRCSDLYTQIAGGVLEVAFTARKSRSSLEL